MESYLDILEHINEGVTLQEACKTEYIQENFLNGNSKEVDAIVKKFKESFKPINAKLKTEFKKTSFREKLNRTSSHIRDKEINAIVDFLKKKSCKIISIPFYITYQDGVAVSATYYAEVIYKNYILRFTFSSGNNGVVAFNTGVALFDESKCDVPKEVIMYIIQEFENYYHSLKRIKKNKIFISVKDVNTKSSQIENLINKITSKYPNITAKPKLTGVSFTLNNDEK